jgi:hypothetical protein
MTFEAELCVPVKLSAFKEIGKQPLKILNAEKSWSTSAQMQLPN